MYRYETDKMHPHLGFALQQFISSAIDEHVPELRADFPPIGQYNCEIAYDHEICIVTMEFKFSGIPAIGTIPNDRFAELKHVVGSSRDYVSLKAKPALMDCFTWKKFLLALEVSDQAVDWDKALVQVIDWLNDLPLNRANASNLARVKSAIPEPPRYSLATVQKAMWVLECEQTCIQGTAFEVAQYGFVTNDHVVRGSKAMQAFQIDDISRKYQVNVVAQNPALDLAIIDIVGAIKGKHLRSTTIKQSLWITSQFAASRITASATPECSVLG